MKRKTKISKKPVKKAKVSFKKTPIKKAAKKPEVKFKKTEIKKQPKAAPEKLEKIIKEELKETKAKLEEPKI